MPADTAAALRTERRGPACAARLHLLAGLADSAWRGLLSGLAAAALLATGTPGLAAEPPRASLAEALACMDGLFAAYGAGPVMAAIDGVNGASGYDPDASRAVLLAATEAMSRRSGALRPVPGGPGSAGAGADASDIASAVTVTGRLARLDASVVESDDHHAVCLGAACLPAGEGDHFRALGLELGIRGGAAPDGLAGSSASVLALTHAAGGDEELVVELFGRRFDAGSDAGGSDPAVRALVSAGALEAYGRLFQVPYWRCIGADPSQARIAAEIDGWWEQLAADRGRLVRWLQIQMGARGLYRGQADGIALPALLRAVAACQQALGLAPDLHLDANFLRAYLAADQDALAARARARLDPPPGEGVVWSRAPPTFVVDRRGARRSYPPGETYTFDVHPGADGFLYCWLIDDHQRLEQFCPLPGPLAHAVAVSAATVVSFPDRPGLRFFASSPGNRETVACAVSEVDLGGRPLTAEAPAIHDAGALQQALARATGGNYAFASYEVAVDPVDKQPLAPR